MRKLLLFITFVSFFFCIGYSQRTYYGYKSRYDSDESKISCKEALSFVKNEGIYLSRSFCTNSNSISSISWYKYDGMLFCTINFKILNDMNKSFNVDYLFGGWEYSFKTYNTFKNEFDKAESKGQFYWDYIEKAKIDCD
tara:strand:+ start:1028 stop:1444 length:417 start_codon:yes stop_codon:yes gene_type:complete